ncbi:MAG: hypothetical protein IJ017_09545 [Oscillospiraceae bacterium]|nr:hypothetical protein [Oscillospiraceae bacterium]
MKKNKYRKMVRFWEIMMVIEVLLIISFVVPLIFGVGHPLEWIVLIIGDICGIPSTIRLKQKYEEAAKAAEETEERSSEIF